MRGVIEAIYALGVRDWFDYVAVIAPIGLSVVAIWISLYTVHTQNRIALFEINYSALHQIKAILGFAECSELCENKAHVAIQMDSFFETGIEIDLEQKGWSHVFLTINKIEKKAMVKSLLRTKAEEKAVWNIIQELQTLMLATYANPNDFNLEELQKFRGLCTEFTEKMYEKLEKRVRV